jgi:phosphatidylglycerol:prolipoprotein diacylglycerol transferase
MRLGELLTGASYFVGALVFLWAARQRKMATQGIGIVAAVGFLSGMLGAKLTQLIAQGWPVSLPATAALDPRIGGRALVGGLIFGGLGVEIAKRQLGIRRSTGDLFALALPAGEAVGRLGCYFNGCCYGASYRGIGAVWQHEAWRHPSQLYSAASAAALFVALLALRPHVQKEGALFKLYLAGFAASRLGLEFLRHRESLVFGLSPVQWFCVEILVTLALVAAFARRRPELEK